MEQSRTKNGFESSYKLLYHSDRYFLCTRFKVVKELKLKSKRDQRKLTSIHLRNKVIYTGHTIN